MKAMRLLVLLISIVGAAAVHVAPAEAAMGNFANPLFSGRQDPGIVGPISGYYLYAYTDGNDTTGITGLPLLSWKIHLNVSPTIEGAGYPVLSCTIWTESGTSNWTNVWAPEIAYIGGQLYIYFTAQSTNAGSGNPQYNATYWIKANDPANVCGGGWTSPTLLAFPNYTGKSLDGKVLQKTDGTLYFVFVGDALMGAPGNSAPVVNGLWIAPMSSATAVSADAVQITKPMCPLPSSSQASCTLTWEGSYRWVTDASVTNGSATITSSTANFTSADVGKNISGFSGIWSYATIASVQSATSATMSHTATATGTNVTAAIGKGTNEAPTFTIHGSPDVISIAYSGNDFSTDNYALGVLYNTDGNVTNPSSWTKKSSNPVFSTSTGNGVYGPGTATLTTSPDSTQNWMIYASKDGPGSTTTRHISTQSFTYNADNTPNFGTPIGVNVAQSRPSGETTIAPSPMVYEAEMATVANSTMDFSIKASGGWTERLGGTASVQFDRVNVDKVPPVGTFRIGVRYSYNSLSSTTQTIKVNAGTATNLTFPGTGSWTAFKTVWTNVSLVSGDNTIKFAGSGTIRIDAIILPRQEAEWQQYGTGVSNISRSNASLGLNVTGLAGSTNTLTFSGTVYCIDFDTYTISFLYSNGGSQNAEWGLQTFYDGGSATATLTLPPTGGWNTFSVVTMTSNLNGMFDSSGNVTASPSSTVVITPHSGAGLGTAELDSIAWCKGASC